AGRVELDHEGGRAVRARALDRGGHETDRDGADHPVELERDDRLRLRGRGQRETQRKADQEAASDRLTPATGTHRIGCIIAYGMGAAPRAADADRPRCGWSSSDPLYQAYHDREWGVPLHHDRRLFELLCLEGAQAGLAWITILRKRAGYRRAFDRFD